MLFKPRTRLLPALTVLLSLLGLACGGGEQVTEPAVDAVGAPGHDVREEGLQLQAYRDSDFNLCDVKVLGAFWGSLEYDTKSTISDKLQDVGEQVVLNSLAQARGEALSGGEPTCSIDEMGYTPADAQAVADNWGMSVSEAKSAMFNKYLNGGKQGLAEDVERSHGVALERANMREGEDEEGGVQAPMEPLDAFFEFSDMCEAKMLSNFWGQPIVETKARIGAKYLAGQEALVSEEISRANGDGNAAGCDWSDVAYGYEDAVVLAKYWGISVEDTKATIVDKIRIGNRPYLLQELGAAYAD